MRKAPAMPTEKRGCRDGGPTGAAPTNAASSGVTLDRRPWKALARRSDRPGLPISRNGAAGCWRPAPWSGCSSARPGLWAAMFVHGVLLTVPAYAISHETAHGTAFRQPPAERNGPLDHVAALHGRAAAPALHPHQSHLHLASRQGQPDAVRHAAGAGRLAAGGLGAGVAALSGGGLLRLAAAATPASCVW